MTSLHRGCTRFARNNEGEALRGLSVSFFEPIYVGGQGLFVVYDTLVPHQLFLTRYSALVRHFR